eukprot:TRINITY_DN23034_c0_g1_i1.p1 TRINITY_DN23034_c0_g1~~TRINITY_DN23034_c0_g1_i1.p1  ORF type:complete len:386 (+),score=127.67 TRINITY_DN23034_c0_g1_i1:73-1158(+)
MLPTGAALLAAAAACPCSSPELCQPVAAPPERREVFGFSVGGNWSNYDLTRVTTIAWRSDPDLVCAAHRAGVRVLLQAKPPISDAWLANASARSEWVAAHVAEAKAKFVDGTNFDWESPVAVGSPNKEFYMELVRETTEAFHAWSPHTRVSVDVAWSPNNIDGRAYDYTGLAAHSDLLFVMVYDTRSQIWGKCVASANSPSAVARLGLQQYLDLGIPASKLVMGLPWYGYDYPCVNGTPADSSVCEIAAVPFRGAPCSDAAGSQHNYAELAEQSKTASVRRDPVLQSPYYNYVAADKTVHQVWFDDPESLRIKYAIAAEMKLIGVGFWNLDTLGDVASLKGGPAASPMWQAVDAFLKPARG